MAAVDDPSQTRRVSASEQERGINPVTGVNYSRIGTVHAALPHTHTHTHIPWALHPVGARLQITG